MSVLFTLPSFTASKMRAQCPLGCCDTLSCAPLALPQKTLRNPLPVMLTTPQKSSPHTSAGFRQPMIERQSQMSRHSHE